MGYDQPFAVDDGLPDFDPREVLKDKQLQLKPNPSWLPPMYPEGPPIGRTALPRGELKNPGPRPQDTFGPVHEALSPTVQGAALGEAAGTAYLHARSGRYTDAVLESLPILAGMFVPGAPKGKGGMPRVEKPIRVHHGSPHDFDKFDLSKIGTGEGAQAYGHGLYFAENEGVAKSYRDATTTSNGPAGQATYLLKMYRGDKDAALSHLRAEPGRTPEAVAFERETAKLIEAGEMNPGKMYEVNLHATPEQFLDWDRPLSGQPPAILDSVKRAYAKNVEGQVFPDGSPATPRNLPQYGSSAFAGLGRTPEHGTELLREAGIPGIKYLDQGSRGWAPDHLQKEVASWGQLLRNSEARGDAGQTAIARQKLQEAQDKLSGAMKPTSNYVVWSPEIIEIVRKYGLAGLAMIPPALQAAKPEVDEGAPFDYER